MAGKDMIKITVLLACVVAVVYGSTTPDATTEPGTTGSTTSDSGTNPTNNPQTTTPSGAEELMASLPMFLMTLVLLLANLIA